MVGIGLFLPRQETYVHIIVHIGTVDLHTKNKCLGSGMGWDGAATDVRNACNYNAENGSW